MRRRAWWMIVAGGCAASDPPPSVDSDAPEEDTARPAPEVASFSLLAQIPWDAATNRPAVYAIGDTQLPPNLLVSLHDRVSQVTGGQPTCTIQVVWDDPETVLSIPPEDGRLVGLRFPGPAATRQSGCAEAQTEASFSESAIADAMARIRASVDVVLSLGGPVDPDVLALFPEGSPPLGASFNAVVGDVGPIDVWLPAAYGLGYEVDGEGRIVLEDGLLRRLDPSALTVDVDGALRPATALWRVDVLGAFDLPP